MYGNLTFNIAKLYRRETIIFIKQTTLSGLTNFLNDGDINRSSKNLGRRYRLKRRYRFF